MLRSKPTKVVSVTDILSNHTPEIQALVEELRQLIQSTVPQAQEKAQPRWHSLNYSHPEAGYFCGIFPFENQVKLMLEFGVLLSDPDELLQGDGKQVRFVLIRSKKDIHTKAIQQLIQAALDLPTSRATKLALIQSGAKPIGRK